MIHVKIMHNYYEKGAIYKGGYENVIVDVQQVWVYNRKHACTTNIKYLSLLELFCPCLLLRERALHET